MIHVDDTVIYNYSNGKYFLVATIIIGQQKDLDLHIQW